MNKLVIVGNGFDLAHGLPTSYKHFIDDFWKNLKNTFDDERIKELVYINPAFTGLVSGEINNFSDFLINIKKESDNNSYRIDQSKIIVSSTNGYGESGIRFKFENDFFKEINVKTSIENWVDIENEYYLELKRISKRRDSHYQGSLENFEKKQTDRNKSSVKKLNGEFEQIRFLFIDYLKREVEIRIWLNSEPDNPFDFLEIFKMEYLDLKNNPSADILKEFAKSDAEDLIRQDEEFKNYLNKTDPINKDIHLEHIYPPTVFLNFNYTRTLTHYNGVIKNPKFGYSKIISIHGSLANNKVNFGFGDEMDENYKQIENLNDNEYLRNFKSFKYSQNPNYKNLLDYIDSAKFQVYIMGHSCGLSDRTLLNTIFEHENCRSIKVFYYQWVNEVGNKKDNFTEIVQNISRHFSNKKVMREKIVNKSLCVPFPQNIRFQKLKLISELIPEMPPYI